ncbi:kynurenine/alpha-aminoadipate aminotransferase, mitochondrial-like [Pseudomyrmex gracilis]|uniref:kynurenine/alpha-aminoadipate aminotransferase, mitochondrial-like n=1 Tax=Pseudomyrmex gracilis TaxID=219809 RepID=UPI0009953062|nr:kynurenine/alpha-aminoadipate aminotransferase, mitochondrial-like [Pseudomyrmex gracilis]
MDYTKFYAKITGKRRTNLIRQLTKLHANRPNCITLAAGMPNVATFPIEDISVTYKHNIALQLDKHSLSTALQYGSSQGYLPLLEKWKELQNTWHTPRRNDWNVALTNGSLDGCNKIFEMMIDENDPVMVQTPTYTGILGALAPLAPEVIEINQDAEGIIPEEIADHCERRLADGKSMPKLIYVNPTAANPTGATLSEIRRKRVYELARKYNFLIVEDDPYCFLHFLDKQPTSFFSLDTDGRVIRLDSFSKFISAGLRVGVVTAHKDIVDKLVVHIENSILHPSSLSQMLLCKLFEIWTPNKFEKHFEDIRKFYRDRRDVMLTMMEKHLTGLAEWYVSQGGMFLWVKVLAVSDVLDLVMNKCVPQGVFVLPGNVFHYNPDKPNCHLRLSYSYASPEEMDKGLSVLANIIREEAAARATEER